MTTHPQAPSRALLVLLVALSSLGEISTQLLLPSLSAIEADLGGRPGSIHVALGAFVAAFGLGQLLFGPLSDRLGRRRVILAGLALHLAATAGLFYAHSIPEFAVLRALQGIGACAAYVLARAVVRDVWRDGAAPALALMMFGTLLTIAIAPVVGGLVVGTGAGWRAAQAVVLALALATAFATVALYRESNAAPNPGAGRLATLAAGYRDLLDGRAYRAHAMALAFSYGTLFTFVAGSSFVFVETLGRTRAEYGLLFGLIVSGLVLGTHLARGLTPRLGAERVVRIGGVLMLGGTLAAAILHHVPGLALVGIVIPQMVVTTGGGLILPATLAGAVLPNPHRAGMAAGFMGFAQMAGATGGGVMLALLPSGSALPMLAVQLGLAAAGFAAFRLTLRGAGAAPQPAAS
ncbi:MFS transporter [Salinarimonas soli]|uniref:Multidrug effflux MFS transporter n=1 Tax=Salinarimonas soli TaxID=1638099 RepID=A0A5B2VGK4_9HYPH|nr:MFS transporter [Salinarimonas soli]KAA2238241.1 multidrug effflux MFS transporter [Salinarimonas soli]